MHIRLGLKVCTILLWVIPRHCFGRWIILAIIVSSTQQLQSFQTMVKQDAKVIRWLPNCDNCIAYRVHDLQGFADHLHGSPMQGMFYTGHYIMAYHNNMLLIQMTILAFSRIFYNYYFETPYASYITLLGPLY